MLSWAWMRWLNPAWLQSTIRSKRSGAWCDWFSIIFITNGWWWVRLMAGCRSTPLTSIQPRYPPLGHPCSLIIPTRTCPPSLIIPTHTIPSAEWHPAGVTKTGIIRIRGYPEHQSLTTNLTPAPPPSRPHIRIGSIIAPTVYCQHQQHQHQQYIDRQLPEFG